VFWKEGVEAKILYLQSTPSAWQAAVFKILWKEYL